MLLQKEQNFSPWLLASGGLAREEERPRADDFEQLSLRKSRPEAWPLKVAEGQTLGFPQPCR